VNRSLYLNTTSQSGATQEVDRAGMAKLRADAIDALIVMLNDPHEEPRAAAAMALGRMRVSDDPRVLEALVTCALKDKFESVRGRALLAIGLIGGDDGASFLFDYNPPTPYLHASALISMGLLRDPPDRISVSLHEELANGVASTGNAAWWALSQHPDMTHARADRQLLQTTQSPWLASAAIPSMGKAPDELGDRILADVLLDDAYRSGLPSWKFLTQIARNKPLKREATAKDGVDPTIPRSRNADVPPLQQWYRYHKRLIGYEPTPFDLGKGPNYKRMEPVTGIEEIYKTRLRASAAIALSGAQDPERAVEVLARLISERDSKYNTLPKCFALISLAEIGSPESFDTLLSIAGNMDGRRIKRQKDLESPMRGFAVIGLGLYARIQTTEQGPYDRPRLNEALELLRQRLADEREKLEVRAAAAVALGLSGRTANLRPMISEYRAFDEASPLLGGYVLLGRALLSDQNVIGPARAALDRKPHHDKTTDLLARRAAVLALGVAGTSEAIPHLIWAWDQPYYVNREVIVALSLCDAPGVAGHLLPRLSSEANRYERAFMAESVGRLLSEDSLPPLSVFLVGSNYTMKNGLINPYRSLDNPFLYDYLIPQFEEAWY
jgi:HEAT repeat protein